MVHLRLLLTAVVLVGVPVVCAERCQNLVRRNPHFEPIRIHTEILERNATDDQTEFVESTLLPHVVNYWQSALQVRRVVGKLIIPRNPLIGWPMCGQSTLPQEYIRTGIVNADILLRVRITQCPLNILMTAQVCQRDACGRPVSGYVRICSHVLVDYATKFDQLASILTHEFAHVFGMHSDSFEHFRNRWSMKPILPEASRVTVPYGCRKNADGKLDVRWNTTELPPGYLPYDHTFHTGIVRAIDARGLVAAECRCPVDVTRSYSSDDVTHCFNNPSHCAVALTLPRVTRATREHFGCPSAVGMELQNTNLHVGCWGFFESHWKSRLLKEELMNHISHHVAHHISAITFALFEDSGWYRTDHSKLTRSLPGTRWGSQAGCGFLTEPCMNADATMVINKDSFCLPREDGLGQCSRDATRMTVCDAGNPDRWLSGAGAQREVRDIVPQYQYGGKYIHDLGYYDHCPIYDSHPINLCTDSLNFDGNGIAGPDSRCFDVDGDPHCIPVTCAADGRSYTIHHSGSRKHVQCFRQGQRIRMNDRRRVTCESPRVICASWRFAHLSPSSPFNRVPHFMSPELESAPPELLHSSIMPEPELEASDSVPRVLIDEPEPEGSELVPSVPEPRAPRPVPSSSMASNPEPPGSELTFNRFDVVSITPFPGPPLSALTFTRFTVVSIT